MRNWTDSQHLQERRLPTDNLKCCPLCGVLNAVQNSECFVCGWYGRFDHDPALIEACLVELLERCPELVDAMAEVPSAPALPWWRRVVEGARGLFRRGLDLRV